MNSAGRWISVEGLNGVGKTYLIRQLADRLGERCTMLTELTDQGADQLTGQVIAALGRAGGTFLRTGHPLTETFALLALKIYEYERVSGEPQTAARLVLEDRGPDTVAVYQAAILAAGQPLSAAVVLAERIREAATLWRPPPALTLLLVDDIDSCLDR